MIVGNLISELGKGEASLGEIISMNGVVRTTGEILMKVSREDRIIEKATTITVIEVIVTTEGKIMAITEMTYLIK